MTKKKNKSHKLRPVLQAKEIHLLHKNTCNSSTNSFILDNMSSRKLALKDDMLALLSNLYYENIYNNNFVKPKFK